ncbi:hypothetical protein FB451DRAFT_1172006 [Mycena latifolia]|nr:hypothetical protein FB451DRAFT_1172006 [Mycena latifolia]
MDCADFTYNNARTHVLCKVCAAGVPAERRVWLGTRSALKHLGSDDHKKALGLLEDARRKADDLERERTAKSAAKDLRDLRFSTVPNLRGPIASGASSGAPSLAESAMWEDYNLNGADFDAGDDAEDPHVRHDKLHEEAQTFGLWNPDGAARQLGLGNEDVAAQILEEDEEEDFLAEIMRTAGLEDPEPNNIQGHHNSASPASSEWFPYPSQIMFLLDTLDNLPRLRISSSLMRVFLWILKEAGCKDVPSFDGLRRVQKKIRSDSGIPSIPCKSPLGNIFFMNDPRAIVAQRQSIAYSTTAPILLGLGEPNHVETNSGLSRDPRGWYHPRNLAHPKVAENMDLDILSPMYDAGETRHYYVNKVARLKNGDFIIPVRWLMFRGKVYCDAFSVTFNDQHEATIIDDKTLLVCSDDFDANYLDLQAEGTVPKWSPPTIEAGHPLRMPNPKHEIAGGDPLYSSILDYFGDNVSGNRTKSWNKHWNTYFTHRNLPRKLLQQEFHVHFVSTSPNASILEQFREFKAAIYTHRASTSSGWRGKTTRFCLHVNAGPSDNPMQSEVTGHIGGKGNYFCQKCEVGGTQKEKATDEGYHALFEAGIPCMKERIITELENQVKLACSGVASHVKDSQTQTGVKDVYTQFWIDGLISRFKQMKQEEPDRSERDIQAELVQWTLDNRENIYSAFLTMKVLGFDPTKDTPVEILHTILLGIVKYIWHISHTPWTPEQKQRYSAHLQATETDGLSIHAIRANYIMQYAGSLIGRQLKTIAQTNVFHVYDLVSEQKFMAWKATGELAVLMWFPEIRNLAEYRRDLRVAVANVLDIFAVIDPSKIITKIKYHLLTHIDEDAVEFGPLVGVATEIYECFNAVFRYCSILSNHLALSRDIAVQIGDQEGLKHRLTGSWWSCGEDAEWKQAGLGVRRFLQAHPVLQRLLGWSDGTLLKAVRGQKERVQYALKTTTAARALNFGSYVPDSMWKKCTSVVSESLDDCRIGSWVFVKSEIPEAAVKSGRISEILVNDAGTAVVILELFQVLSTRDELYGMPVLVRRDDETIFSIIPVKSLMFKFNVQHDCHTAKCEATGERARMQERVESDTTEKYIVHATLPRDLWAPIPLFPDRKSKHDELASELCSQRETRHAKRKCKDSEGSSEEEHTAAGSRKRRKCTKKAPQRSVVVLDGLIAGRPKRTVTRSRRAREADEDDNEYNDRELDGNSGDDYSE